LERGEKSLERGENIKRSDEKNCRRDAPGRREIALGGKHKQKVEEDGGGHKVRGRNRERRATNRLEWLV